ncbi:Maf family protein [Paenibacillus daejeonensis]|uniref:Maf family protein n=1 Tax=Paenibacillus daejeonensis TaxID=135193 RepID=UPI00037DDE0C|nr:Maf family protein [Paenibacillus daejeonensis]
MPGQARSSELKINQLVLASASPRRRELLEQLALSLPVKIMPTDTDESTPTHWQPAEIVEQLSLRKARAALHAAGDQAADSLIIGADTIVVMDGMVLGKPQDVEDARRTLTRLQGGLHEVYSGITLLHASSGEPLVRHRMTKVHMKPLDARRIERYVASGEPMDKAGSYGIQGLGATLIEGIDGCYFNVVGMSLTLLSDMLSEYGVESV